MKSHVLEKLLIIIFIFLLADMCYNCMVLRVREVKNQLEKRRK